MKTIRLSLLMALAVIFFSCNQRGQRENQDSNRDGMLVENAKVEADTENDEDFVKEAASGGLMEVELGRYVEQNAMNARVKNFGSMMVRDHTKANDELKSIAANKNITVPENMNDNHRDKLEGLKKKSGGEFDRDYMKEMVDDHEKDINNFRKMMDSDDADPDLKAFASKTLDVLMMHLDSAKSIRDAVNRNKQ